jgi:hypothetical protein
MPMVRHFLLNVDVPAEARKLLGRFVHGDESDAPQIEANRQGKTMKPSNLIRFVMGQAKDAVTLQVQMASFPDGTNHVERTVLNATAKQLVVTTTNSSY